MTRRTRKPSPDKKTFHCIDCDQFKSKKHFSVNNARKDKTSSYCRECMVVRNAINRSKPVSATPKPKKPKGEVPLECECGEPKHEHDIACIRCLRLDGASRGVGSVISALRLLGGLGTTEDIVNETRSCYRNVIRNLQKAEREGVIARRAYEEKTWLWNLHQKDVNPIHDQ